MGSELDQILNSAFGEGDAAEAAAPPAGADIDTGAAAGTTAPQAAEMPAEGAVASVEPEVPFRWENVPKELEGLAKGFQADYTKSKQQLAEERQALEAQRQQYAVYEQLERIAAEDPAQAVEWLRQQADLIARGVQAGEAETDPLSLIAPETETERLLLDRMKSYEAQQQQFQQFYQQQVQRQQEEQIDAEFTALGRHLGRDLSRGEQEQIAAFCVQHRIPNLEMGYKAMSFDQALEQARKNGVNQGATIVQQKAAMAPAPSGMADRAGRVPTEPKTLAECLASSAEELGI